MAFSFAKKVKIPFSKNQSKNRKIYDSAAWRGKNGLRTLRLNLNPYCQTCGMPATMVDHTDPINNGGDPFDITNTQSLCDSCHNKKRRKEKALYG